MDFNKLKEAALAAGITEVEVYSVHKHGIEISAFNGVVENNTSYSTNVMAVRGVYNNQITAFYEENCSDEVIPSIVAKIKDNCSIKNSVDPFFIYPGDESYPELQEKEVDFDKYTLEDKVNICLNLHNKLKEASEYVSKTEVSYSEDSYEVSIVNSNGLNVSKSGRHGFVVAEAVCEKDGETKVGFEYEKISSIENSNFDDLAKAAVEKAVSGFGAESIPSGSYPVVLDKKVVSSLLGAFSGIFAATQVLRNMSFLKGKLGEKIFGDNITLIDDPLSLDAPSQSSFDDEGVACFTKSVVENGVLKTYLHNLTTAAMMGTKSTGNGNKPDISSSVGVSPSNLYLKAGDVSFDDMVSSVENGVYVTSVQGLHAGLNPISGSFNLQSSGFMIENGKVTKPVTLIILSGTLQEMLNNVKHVGSDFEFKRGVGSPSLLIESMAISGK